MEHTQKILLVDDEPEILNLYRAVLKKEGYVLIEAPNGSEALKIAKLEKPDLILMDLKMPVMDGMEAFTKLKDDPETKDLKIAFLTAFSEPTGSRIDVKFAKEMGAIDFIRKGISLDEFIAKVKEYLAK